MDIESELTPSTENEIREAVSKTPGFTRCFSVFFRYLISSILRFGAGNPPCPATEELQPQNEENHSDDEGSTISVVVIPPQPLLSDPIVVNLRKQELGKTVLGVALPVTTGLILYFFTQKTPPVIVRFIVVALSIGCTAIWNGLLLRETYPLTANAAEQIGIAIVLLVFHGMVGSFLPSKLIWIPGLFGSLAMVPFFLAALPPNQQPH